jgi:hypothetical protein
MVIDTLSYQLPDGDVADLVGVGKGFNNDHVCVAGRVSGAVWAIDVLAGGTSPGAYTRR